ncbi:15603_t:CDS:2, partial [Funneliformis geosporum]
SSAQKAIINGKKVEVIDDSKLVTQPAQFSVEDVFKAPNVKGVVRDIKLNIRINLVNDNTIKFLFNRQREITFRITELVENYDIKFHYTTCKSFIKEEVKGSCKSSCNDCIKTLTLENSKIFCKPENACSNCLIINEGAICMACQNQFIESECLEVFEIAFNIIIFK